MVSYRNLIKTLDVMGENSVNGLSEFIELFGFVTDEFILTYNGTIVVLIEMLGIDPEGLSQEEMRRESNQFANQMQGIDRQNIVVYAWMQRKPITIEFQSSGHPIYDAFVQKRQDSGIGKKDYFENRHFVGLEFSLSGMHSERTLKESVPLFFEALHAAKVDKRVVPFLKECFKKWFQGKETYLEVNQKEVERFLVETARPTVAGFLENFKGIQPRVLSWREAIDCLLPLFNLDAPRQALCGGTMAPLNGILANSPYRFDGRMLQVGEQFMDIVALKGTDEATVPHFLDALEEVPFPVIVSSTWRKMNDDKVEGLINLQRRGYKHSNVSIGNAGNDEGKKGSLSKGYKDAVVDHLDHAMTLLKKDGGWFGKFSLFVMIQAPTKDSLAARVKKVESIFYDKACRPLNENVGLMFAWASFCPGSFWKMNHRQLILSNRNYSDFFPLWRMEKGSVRSEHYGGECLAELETRNGNVFHFNLSHSDNLNFLVLGKIGSGKSFAMKYFMIQYFKYGKAFFSVHTKGSDYNDLALAVGGQIIELRTDGAFPINLYGLEETFSPGYLNVLMAVWKNLLQALDHTMSESESDELYEKLQILGKQPKEKRNNRALYRLVGNELKKYIKEFCWGDQMNGRFGRMFDGSPDDPRVFRELSHFTVIDYGGLGEETALGQAAMIFISYMEDQVIHDPAELGTNKFVWIDEGSKIVGHKDSYPARRIRLAGDTWRKTNTSLGFITQKLEDLIELGLDNLFRQACSQYLFFPNPGIDGDLLKASFSFLKDRDIEHIQNMEEKKEVLFVTTYGVHKVLRLIVDPFTALVLESNPKIVARKNELLKVHPFPKNIEKLQEELEKPVDESPAKVGLFAMG